MSTKIAKAAKDLEVGDRFGIDDEKGTFMTVHEIVKDGRSFRVWVTINDNPIPVYYIRVGASSRFYIQAN